MRSSLHFARRAFVGLAVCAATTGVFAQSYPDRPITMIVPWGAGGGTDAVARMLASLMEKDLGQPVNVVNRTGGSGVVGHSAIASAPADGYTIGMITVEITMMHHQKLTELNATSYTPIALVNLDPAGFQVRADSPYKTMNDVLAAVKANPGKFKASGTGQGGIWHLALAGWPVAGSAGVFRVHRFDAGAADLSGFAAPEAAATVLVLGSLSVRQLAAPAQADAATFAPALDAAFAAAGVLLMVGGNLLTRKAPVVAS